MHKRKWNTKSSLHLSVERKENYNGASAMLALGTGLIVVCTAFYLFINIF